MKHASHLFYQGRQRRPVQACAEGIHIWDTNGKRYIDGSSGAMVCNIGHGNPAVLQAMRAQMQTATFGYRLHFETDSSERLAQMTAALTPDGLDRVFLVSGGSEAVESAIKMARQYALAIEQPQRWKVISRNPSYHGSTLGALMLTGYAPLSDPFAPMLQSMPKIRTPRPYLDGRDGSDPAVGAAYADELEQCILAEGAESVLAFIVEPIGGASTGALEPPTNYHERVREICNRYGVQLIHDEVMTGGGRTGHFLGATHYHTEPDIIALSKGFGAGYMPLGAMVARDQMVEKVLDAGGFSHGFTYAGNPLACAAGAAVLQQIDELGLLANAQLRGEQLKTGLHALAQRHPIIGDVRGVGLLLAFELVSDRDSMQPLAASLNAYTELVDIAYELGLIIYSRRTRGGLNGDHFLVCPPLICTAAQIDEILALLDQAMHIFIKKTGASLSNKE